jgi:hypothetical protein
LTPSGTTLQVGQSATLSYHVIRDPSKVSKLQVAISSVTRVPSSIRVLARGGQLYYVRAKVKKVGATTADTQGFAAPFQVYGDDGAELDNLASGPDFPCCGPTETAPGYLEVGDQRSTCNLYSLNSGDHPAAVIFDLFDANGTETKITWTVP